MMHQSEGNLDQPGAMRYLTELVNEWSRQVDDILRPDNDLTATGEGEAIVMPTIEIVALLCERFNAPPPKTDRIERWRRRYLRWFDEEADACFPDPDFRARRRKRIDTTFAWLQSLSEVYWMD